jgi:hypothetical protein
LRVARSRNASILAARVVDGYTECSRDLHCAEAASGTRRHAVDRYAIAAVRFAQERNRRQHGSPVPVGKNEEIDVSEKKLPYKVMTTIGSHAEFRIYQASDFFRFSESLRSEPIIRSSLFSRIRVDLPDATLLRDDFSGGGGPCCLFIRLSPTDSRVVHFILEGAQKLVSSASGGWLLESSEENEPSYWIPQPPRLRTFDGEERILLEEPASVVGFSASAGKLAVAIRTPEGFHLDWVVWRLPAGIPDLCSELSNLFSVERQRTYLWSSQTVYQSPADLYLHLINGNVYQNARAWPRKWKFCCELDAYELYVWLSGLELATGKHLYNLLRRQILFSVIARQSGSGAWKHGEWTDLNECHYRFHNGALLLLENACDEWTDGLVRESLAKGTEFIASRRDETALGLWFLHDSLEDSAEAMDAMYRQTGSIVPGFGAWKPSRILGKSPTNKMILNTHVDTTITLDRYREATGDTQYQALVASARMATQSLLALRPAEIPYRAVYWAVGLTLLPVAQARQLPLPVRALKRMSWMYLVPRLYLLKRLFPRLVMPSGFIDRHLSPPHFDAKYHAVNVMDLVRYWRRFPEEDLHSIIERAIQFVLGNDKSVLRWWVEEKPRQFAIVVFTDALYQLCMLRPDRIYRRYLAEAMLLIEDLGLGLPPSLLGGNVEVLRRRQQVRCPSPKEPRLRVANLGSAGRAELLVVNPEAVELPLAWELSGAFPVEWTLPDGASVSTNGTHVRVPPRGWLWGIEPQQAKVIRS